ncbi:alpha/beta hydrolase [Pseudomonas brassicae]|nr:alpha/beta fold hydrolase [Pseudomonas brassicae]
MLHLLMGGATSAFGVQTLQIPGPHGPLEGTLLSVPAQQAPRVLIVPGSGPTNRDGNSPLGIRAAPYRLLAQGLAQQGISSVRIDKRGLFGSRAAIAHPDQVTLQAYADDVRQWVDHLSQLMGGRCVWLLGHSEGGLVAMLAAQDNPQLCGLLLLATPGRPLAQVLREQLSHNLSDPALRDSALAIVDSLARGEPVSDVPAALEPLFRQQVQGFLISALTLDPRQLLGKVRQPVLIVQGDHDLQVSADDARALQAAKPQAMLRILPGVNHVLKTVPADDREANLQTYAAADLALAPGVIQAIVERLNTPATPRRAL